MYRKTKNPRICFVPSDRVLALVSKLSESSGESRAAICADLMEQVAPVLQDQIAAFESLAASPEKAREIIEGYAAEGRARIDQALLDLGAPDGRRKRNKRGARDAARS